MESYFVKNLPSAVAAVMSTFGLAVEIKISQHRKYEKAYAAGPMYSISASGYSKSRQRNSRSCFKFENRWWTITVSCAIDTRRI